MRATDIDSDGDSGQALAGEGHVGDECRTVNVLGRAEDVALERMGDHDVVADFYQKMVDAEVIEDGLDIAAAYTTDFVNKGVGMDLKPAN